MGQAGAAGAAALAVPDPTSKAMLGGISALSAGMGKLDRMEAKNLKRGAKAFESTGLPGRPSKDDERKSGGRVMKHDDAKADKKMIAKAVHKHEAHDHPNKPLTKLAKGGPAKEPTTKGMLAEKGYQGGGAGAMGRLEKLKKYGR